MAHLYFIRSKTTWECEDYYESKTDVWMFGDRAGYQHFLGALAKAETARRPIDLYKDISRGRNSMYVVLLPAAKTAKKAARLRLVERIVFRTSKPAMELVVAANAAGYRRLAKLIHGVLQPESVFPFLDHVHIDDWFDSWVVKRSVALNIRAPLDRWRKSALGHYASMLYGASRHRLPPDIGHLSPKSFPYRAPVAEAYGF